MPAASRTLFLLAVAAASLGACSGNAGTGGADEALRDEVKKLQAESARQKDQVAQLERKIAALAGDRRPARSGSDQESAAAGPGAAEDTAGVAAAPTHAAAPNAPAIKSFFDSDEGRKTITMAMRAVEDQRQVEWGNRMADGMVTRMTRDLSLTEDQAKKMKDILRRGGALMRETMNATRDLAPDTPDEERQKVQQQAQEKFAEANKKNQEEVKALLSQTQYESYTTQYPWLTGGGGGGMMGGPGGWGGGGGAAVPGRPSGGR